MPVLLCPQGSGLIFSAVHDAAALVVEAEHGGHAVAALAGLQGGRRTLRVSNTARAGPRPGGKPGCNIPGIRQAALIPGGQPRLHQEGRMELGRERLAPLLRPAQNAQAGSPGQIVFSGRIVLQNQRQGTPCVSAGGCRASIERRRPSTPGRMQLPLVISQQVASPRGEVE